MVVAENALLLWWAVGRHYCALLESRRYFSQHASVRFRWACCCWHNIRSDRIDCRDLVGVALAVVARAACGVRNA